MELLPAHPRLKLFLPLLYLVHEDQLISANEIKTINHFLGALDWLTEDEKISIGQWMTITPANRVELPAIKSLIRASLTKRIKPDAGLIELGAELVPESKSAEWVLQALQQQDVLSFLNHEALYHFYPEWRDTQSQRANTVHSFDTSVLQSILDGDQATLIHELKDLIRQGVFDFNHMNLNEHRDAVFRACKLLADKGYGGMFYPLAYGGINNWRAYYSVMETISYADLSLAIKYGVQFGLFGGSVFFLGTQKHHGKYLSDIGTLDLPGCFAMTEAGHGSNVKGLETTAVYHHTSRTFIVHTPNEEAEKEYIGNAALHGEVATVFAKLMIADRDHGVVALLVPIRDKQKNLMPGISIRDCGEKMGLNGVDNGKIKFDQVSVPYDALLDRFISINEQGAFESPIQSENRRFFTMLGTLVGGRIGVPRSALAATKTGLATTIIYSDKRKQFGPEQGAEIPILNYRIHQRRLIPLLAKTYALHFALDYITERFVFKNEAEAQEIEAIAAGLKAYTTWHNTSTLQECRECTGGRGFLSENRIDDLKNDSDVYTTFEGDNTVMMQLVAKSRLTEFKQSFHNIGFSGYISYFASQAFMNVSQKNPLIVRKTDEEHLLDTEFHINAFKYREQDILASVAKRLKRLMDDGMDSFDAFNVCQHHLIEAAEAYIERLVLEQFHTKIESLSDHACKMILLKLKNLYALHTIENHTGWYLESEYMAPVKTKAIRKLVNQLCWEIRQDAVPLVEAFGVPENCLGMIAR